MPAPLLADIPAAVAAGVAKGAVVTGGRVAREVTTYFIVDAVKGNPQLQIHHAILASTNEQKSDSLVAVNMGGGLSTIIIILVLLVGLFCVYKCGMRCGGRCCWKKNVSINKLQH